MPRTLAPFRPRLTRLEDRSTPVNLTTAGGVVTFDLNGASEAVTLSTATSASVTVTSSAGVSVNGSAVAAAYTPYDYTPGSAVTSVVVTDSANGTALTFAGSTAAYALPVAVTLDQSPGVVTFNGTSAFGDNDVSVTTARNVVVSSGASVTTTTGDLSLSANIQEFAPNEAFTGIDIAGAVGSGDGAVSLVGRGGRYADDLHGVYVHGGGSVTTTGSGTVSVTGSGSFGLGGVRHYGVFVSGTNSLIQSLDADVSVTGTGAGGDGGSHFGVYVADGGTISANNSGTTTVIGQGSGSPTGTSPNNHGVVVDGSGSFITSSGGGTSVRGSGGSSGGGDALTNHGVVVRNGGTIFGGTGSSVDSTVTVEGYGGTGTVGAFGTRVVGNGVVVDGGGSVVTSSGGAVSVTGGGSVGLRVVNGGSVSSGGSADLTVVASTMTLGGSLRAGAGGDRTATLRPSGSSVFIDLGGADALYSVQRITGRVTDPVLGLTDAELDTITAGTLVIGNATNAGIRLSADITRPTGTNVRLLSGGGVYSYLTAGGFDTGGGTLVVSPGSGLPFAPLRTGTDATASAVSLAVGSLLELAVNGPAPDTQYSRLVASGTLDLTGVTLDLLGTYQATAGESFTVVSAGSVVGTFSGLPDGGSVTLNGVTFRAAYSPTGVTLTANRAPVVTPLTVPPTGVGGRPLTVSAAATDPDGPGGSLSYAWEVFNNAGGGDASGTGSAFTFTPPTGGSYTVRVRVSDGYGGSDSAQRTVVVSPPPRVVSAIGGVVRVFDPLTGGGIDLTPFPGFSGGISVATADLTGDGRLDVVVGAGPGGGPHVKVFEGLNLSEVVSFFAYAPTFSGGVNVAATADGRIVTGAGAGGGPHVKVFDRGGGELSSFFAYDPSFTGGVRVATGDVDNDGTADIVTGAGPGAAPHVKVFGGVSGAEVASFYAFAPTFGGGVFVAATSGRIAVGADSGGGPAVKVFDGTGTETASFFAFFPGFAGGVRVGFADADADGTPDLIAGAGPGGGPNVRAFRVSPLGLLSDRQAGDPLDPRGVFVG